MRRLSYTDEAENDIAAIAEYVSLSAQSIGTGERFAQNIIEKCEKLASLPGMMGRPRLELRSGLRSVAHRGYVIFFRYGADTLEIINILEGHRDIDAYFAGDDG